MLAQYILFIPVNSTSEANTTSAASKDSYAGGSKTKPYGVVDNASTPQCPSKEND
jgi:hypothetical protein